MKAGPPHDSPPDARWDDDDPLWDLLGRAPRPEPDGWFATRALARCRKESKTAEVGIAAHFRFAQIWRWALGSGLAASMAIALMVAQVNSGQVNSGQIHPPKADNQKNVQEAFQIVAAVDTDADSPSPSWQDSSL